MSEGEKSEISHPFSRLLDYAVGKKVIVKSHREIIQGTLISRDKRFNRLIIEDEKGNTHVIPISSRWTIMIPKADAHE